MHYEDGLYLHVLSKIAQEQLQHPHPPEYEGGFRVSKQVIVDNIHDDMLLDGWKNHHIHGWIPEGEPRYLRDEEEKQ